MKVGDPYCIIWSQMSGGRMCKKNKKKNGCESSPLRRDSLKRDRHPLYSRSLVVVMGVITIIIIIIVTQVNGFAEKQYGLSASFLFFLLYFSLFCLLFKFHL